MIVRVSRILTAALLALGLAVVPALAQDKPAPGAPGSDERLRQRGEAYHSAPESAQEPAEVQATARLNAEIAALNAEAGALEGEEQAEYARAQANYQKDVADADAAQRRWEADKAAADAAHAEWVRSREVWENMVRACERSGRRDCRPPQS